jgi:hypothetical protein
MPRRKRLVVKTPHGHWQTMIFIASLRVDRIAAPCVLDGLVAGDRRAAEIALQPPEVPKRLSRRGAPGMDQLPHFSAQPYS